MIAHTRYVSFEVSTIMKRSRQLDHRTLNEASDDADNPPEVSRGSITRIGAVLMAAIILSCIHREIEGPSDGSLVAYFAGHANETLHYLASSLLKRSP
jgi:hypothetical protein